LPGRHLRSANVVEQPPIVPPNPSLNRTARRRRLRAVRSALVSLVR
jgi:hypothetical protein